MKLSANLAQKKGYQARMLKWHRRQSKFKPLQHSVTLLTILILQSCGTGTRLSNTFGPKSTKSSTSEGTESETPAAATSTETESDTKPFAATFTSLTENAIVEDKSPVKIEVNFSHSDSGKWSVYVSDKQNGLIGSKIVAKDLELTQSSFEWVPTDFAAGTYFITIVVERLGETKIFQPLGEVVLASKDANNTPFVKISSPNNTFRMNNNQFEVIPNQNRLRFALSEPLRVKYKYLDIDNDPVTLKLKASKDGEATWQTLLENIVPGEPIVKDGDEYLFEWTPPADFDKNMYTLRLEISDGKAESFSEQKFIGIGDVTWNTEVSALYAQNCALSGCHDAATRKSSKDYTIFANIAAVNLTGYNGEVATHLNAKCSSCHGETSPRKGIKLNTFANAKANAQAIKAVLDAGTMPVTETANADPALPPTVTPVTLGDTEKNAILKWITDGALEASVSQPAVQGAQGNANSENQLVKYWLESKGTNNRDKKAMPPGPAPLAPEKLGKFLIWDMQGSNWNDGQKRYDGVGNERKREN